MVSLSPRRRARADRRGLPRALIELSAAADKPENGGFWILPQLWKILKTGVSRAIAMLHLTGAQISERDLRAIRTEVLSLAICFVYARPLTTSGG